MNYWSSIYISFPIHQSHGLIAPLLYLHIPDVLTKFLDPRNIPDVKEGAAYETDSHNMATVSAPPDLSYEGYTLYHVTDDYLSNVLVFHGHVSTGASVNSSRIQVAIFSCAGWQHYPRITVSPTSPLYAAVNHLPREKQGDEVCRGIAVALLKYFAELSDDVRKALVKRAQKIKGSARLPKMFDEMHAAEIANRMEKSDKSEEVVRDLRTAYADKLVSATDLDLWLPTSCFQPRKEGSVSRASIESEDISSRYGVYSDVVEQLGDTVFIPTTKLRRAPSKASSISKGIKFATGQKEALRLAMCEIVDTEERYVAKTYDLVHSVIQECRQKAKNKATTSTSPDEEALARLFPPCLDSILEVNMGFLGAIRSSLEATEAEAFDDIAKGPESSTVVKKHDPLGAVAFGKTMLEWFPKFSEPYKEYMRLQPNFSSTLSSFMRDQNSTFTKRVQETGEQKLRSLLMEPVQRLPRYSLLIDAMTNTMPASHPALKPLLKARDVVTDICALDSGEADDKDHTHSRLKDLVEGWPSRPISQGRLITAVDVACLKPPFRLDKQTQVSRLHMCLVFSDNLVLLEKTPDCATSSRGFMANLDKPASFSVSQLGPAGLPQQSLIYIWSKNLNNILLTHSSCGRMVFVADIGRPGAAQSGCECFALVGADEGKALKLCEDISKARIESRFTEQERNSDRWSLHSFQNSSSVQIFTTVCEEESIGTSERHGSAIFRVVFGKSKTERQRQLSLSSPYAVASISKTMSGYKVEIDNVFGSSSVDSTSLEDLFNTLCRRFSALLVRIYSTDNSRLVSSLIASHLNILSAVTPRVASSTKSYKVFRPPSPTKLLASFLGSGSTKDVGSSKSAAAVPVLGDIPSIRPATSAPPAQPKPSIERSDSKVKLVGNNQEDSSDSLQMLEQTLTAYVLSLRSRAGNIVGRTLKSREFADQVAVNDLYNVLLEDPGRIQAAAEVSNDVLFAAFENFTWNAWKAEIGPILTIDGLKTVQQKFDSSLPMDFDSFFKGFLSDLSPQNRRAFAAMIKLLADLLDASGNDGDRGALMVAFAELLSSKRDALSHIALLDRLVDDYDKLFEDSTAIGFSSPDYPFYESTSQTNASKSGSVNSHSSSFRKRFGFGLSRDNSKHEAESKVSSIIRSLSKSKGGSEPNSQPSSLSKGSLVRSRSTDSDSRISAFLRPLSRDRAFPSNTSLSSEQAFGSRPNSSHSSVHILEAIGELPPKSLKSAQKKKRRSSLSDLPPLNAATSSLAPLDFSPLQLRHGLGLTPVQTPAAKQTSPPQPTNPTTPTRIGSTRLGSPVRRQPRKDNITSPTMSKIASLPTQSRKENIVPPTVSKLATPLGSSLPRPRDTSPPKGYLSERAINRKSDDVTAALTSPKKRSESQTGIPTPRVTARERSATAYSRAESPTKRSSEQSSPQKTQKLRVQSPQKLRERLNNEKQFIALTESNIRAEMTKIGEELSSTSTRPLSSGSPIKATTLQARMTALEAKLQSSTSDISNRVNSAQKDLERALIVSERRAKKLEELFKEATAENEALYDRFNKELAKAVKNVRAGPTEGIEELKSRLSDTSTEFQKMKKENWRLKREIAGLKAQTE